MSDEETLNAEVVSVFPNKVRIKVDKLDDFRLAETSLRIGSYLEISDNENAKLLAVIENFSIEVTEKGEKRHILEAKPLGTLRGGDFTRGGDELAIPPKSVKPAAIADINLVYSSSVKAERAFKFSTLSRQRSVPVPVDGDRFFNKHVAIVGSTGSGKSHTVACLVQKAVASKAGEYPGLNNSHVVIFDIHSEYRSAFPTANFIGIADLRLPYWLLNSEELEELFIDTEANDHRQRNAFKEAVVSNKRKHAAAAAKDKVHYDYPSYFNIQEVVTYIDYRNNEKYGKEGGKTVNIVKWKDKTGASFEFNEETRERMFEEGLTSEIADGSKGPLNGERVIL